MSERLPKYERLAPEGIAVLRGLEHYLNTDTGLEASLLELVRLRASLMNGCGFCRGLHTAELRKQHESAERTGELAEWRGSNAYTQRERAALGWTEAVTNVQVGHVPDAVYEQALEHLSETELVNLTLAIASINAWNRLAIAFRVEWKPKRPVVEP